MKRIKLLATLAAVAMLSWTGGAVAQTTSISAEYLMTYVAQLDAPYPIDNSLVIVNVKPDGHWVKGPRINGTFIPPGGDWLQVLPSGALRLDVRATLKTDDGALIYVSYNGILQHSKESAEKLGRGEVLTTKDIPYFVVAPTMQTSAEKYAWLNSVQLASKMVELKLGEGGYVKYDVYVLR